MICFKTDWWVLRLGQLRTTGLVCSQIFASLQNSMYVHYLGNLFLIP